MRNVDFEGLRGIFCLVPQTALLVNFVASGSKTQNQIFGRAKSLEKMAFFVRGQALDPFRWAGAVSAILSEASIAPAFAAGSQDLAAPRRLPCRRFAVGADLCGGGGSSPSQL